MSRRSRSFGERYPDSMRSGSSYNLIAGELNEARMRIPRVDLRERENAARLLMLRGVEPFPARPWRGVVREHVAEHWGSYVGGAGLFAWVAAIMMPMLGWKVWWWVVLLFYMLIGGFIDS